jgi:hypothetical protein
LKAETGNQRKIGLITGPFVIVILKTTLNLSSGQGSTGLRTPRPGFSMTWVPLLKKDVALDPIAVGRFGAQGIMLEAHDFADLVEEFEFWVGNEAFAGL